MADGMKVLLFGDQTTDPRGHLRDQLLNARTNILLNHFVQKLNVSLKHEISCLPKSEQEGIPTFSTVEELADPSSIGKAIHPGLASALLCISQLTQYFEFACTIHLNQQDPSDTVLVGLCTGLFAAAAVASAPLITDLVPLGVEVVLIAFRLGTYINQTALHLDVPGPCGNSWSSVVGGTTEKDADDALAGFHKDTGIPVAKQAYISASNVSSVTISGPPSTLEQLFNSSYAFGNARYPVAINGPYHAKHLHQEINPQRFWGSSYSETADILGTYRTRLPIISSSTGSQFDSDLSTRDLLRHIIDDVLCQPLQLEKILDRCVYIARHRSAQLCDIYPFDPSLAGISLVNRLKTETTTKVPPDRFDVEKHYDPSGKKRNTSHTPYGCFIEEPGLFDPRFFNMSPREATQTDPMHRLGLTSAYEALEMSGYVPNRTPSTRLDRIGTFYGQTSDDWREINAAQEVDTYFITGGVRAFAPVSPFFLGGKYLD
ncbi:MAG: hypothetical protein Q9220_000494 [cf. Caloplaca sp. 1 TL-2023]